jgi:hypothetical protein
MTSGQRLAACGNPAAGALSNIPQSIMKTLLKSTPLVILMLGLSACQRASRQDEAKVGSHAVASPATAADPQQPAKWPMPEAMMKPMRDMEQDIRAFAAAAEQDHAALAAKIDAHINQVISNCTMEGKAHDALHEWLMPFRQLNKDYATAPDAATQVAKFKALQEALAAFHERFE